MLDVMQTITNHNRNNKHIDRHCGRSDFNFFSSPLADDELINYLYNSFNNNNLEYYRNEIFHYEVITHFFPELLNYDFYGQGNLYSEELKKKFNPKNKKHLHYTYINKTNVFYF